MEGSYENNLSDCNLDTYIAGDQITNNHYITMFQEKEREFVVTHNADIKSITYFTGRQTELEVLRQRVEEGRKSVLVSGMGRIGKTQICKKLFEEYINQHGKGEKELFDHVGYIEYNEDMGSSLQHCLKHKKQENPVQDREATWRELEYLASDGRLLLIVDNVNCAGWGGCRIREVEGHSWSDSIDFQVDFI